MSYVQPIGYERASEADERRRRLKRLTALFLVGLLFLLALAVLYFLLFVPNRLAVQTPGQPFQLLYSIYGLNRPYSVAVDSKGQTYVSDTGNARVLMFDNRGEYLRQLGTDRLPGKVYAPYGGIVDERAGRFYVSDFTAGSVTIFDTGGKFVRRFPNGFIKEFGKIGFTPFDVEMYKGKLYVTSNDGILIFNKNGQFLAKWGTGARGNRPGEFDYPNGLAIDQKRGRIYVADVLNRRVVAMDSKGKILWMLGKPDVDGNIVSFFGLPRGIAVDPQGRVYVTDTFHFKIVVLGPNGNLISVAGDRGVEDAKFNFPEGISIDKDGVLYVADRENNRVQALRMVAYPKPTPADLSTYRVSFQSFAEGKPKEAKAEAGK